MFACSTYPAEGEWLESVRQEAIDNVRRLRNHPSIVIWCGGNECTDAWYNWDISSPLMMWHQRGGVEVNKVIEWYVNSEYGETKDFRQFLYASQLLQGDAMRTAIVGHARLQYIHFNS
jgi:beta-galactosidase/beta-glucuronidase